MVQSRYQNNKKKFFNEFLQHSKIESILFSSYCNVRVKSHTQYVSYLYIILRINKCMYDSRLYC